MVFPCLKPVSLHQVFSLMLNLISCFDPFICPPPLMNISTAFSQSKIFLVTTVYNMLITCLHSCWLFPEEVLGAWGPLLSLGLSVESPGCVPASVLPSGAGLQGSPGPDAGSSHVPTPTFACSRCLDQCPVWHSLLGCSSLHKGWPGCQLWRWPCGTSASLVWPGSHVDRGRKWRGQTALWRGHVLHPSPGRWVQEGRQPQTSQETTARPHTGLKTGWSGSQGHSGGGRWRCRGCRNIPGVSKQLQEGPCNWAAYRKSR